jgi:hypothetical protein
MQLQAADDGAVIEDKDYAQDYGSGRYSVMTDAAVGLADAIAALREQLLAAVDEGKDAEMRFRLAPVELSLQVAVTKGADGRIGWKVLGLGGSYASSVTQTLVLRLEPLWRQGDGSFTPDFVIADQSAQAPHLGPRRTADRPS